MSPPECHRDSEPATLSVQLNLSLVCALVHQTLSVVPPGALSSWCALHTFYICGQHCAAPDAHRVGRSGSFAALLLEVLLSHLSFQERGVQLYKVLHSSDTRLMSLRH